MTRQDEFKAELFDLLRRYNVEMSVVETSVEEQPSGYEEQPSGYEEQPSGYAYAVTGINFWSYTQHDGEGNEIGEMINLTVGCWENGKEVEQ